MTAIADVGVIGMGHVGSLTANDLSTSSRIVTYDIAGGEEYPLIALTECDFIVVCVNTPSLHDGSADLAQVERAFEAMPPGIPVVLRSTVPPGTTDKLAKRFEREVVFWPEYVGETRFILSPWGRLTQEAPFQLFGAKKSAVTTAWLDLIAETYGPLVRLHRVEPSEAELVKYMENSWFAVKITFVNEFRRLTEGLGLDWRSVREGWLLDPRVDRDHSDAFASDPGYGGKCLPKDVAGLLRAACAVGLDLPLLSAVESINAQTRHCADKR